MKTIILSVILIVTLGCSKSNEEKSFTPQAIVPTLIGKGYFSGNENISAQNTVIYNSATWNNILITISPWKLQQFTETTGVDFNNYQLIAVIDTLYPSPNYEVKITTITENENNIVVKYEKLVTPTGLDVYAQSFHIVKMPKSIKPVVFVLLQ